MLYKKGFKQTYSNSNIQLERLIQPFSKNELNLSYLDVLNYYSRKLYPVITNYPLTKEKVPVLGNRRNRSKQFLHSKHSFSPPLNYNLRKRKKDPIGSYLILDAPGVYKSVYLTHIDICSSKLVSVLLGRSCYLYNMNTKAITRVLGTKRKKEILTGARFSECGNFLAIGSSGGVMNIHDVNKEKVVRVLSEKETGKTITSLAWSSSILSNGTSNGKVIVGDVRMKNFVVDLINAHSEGVIGLEFNEAGNVLASSGNDSIVKIWGLRRNKVNVSFSKHDSPVKALGFNPKRDNMIVTGGGRKDKMMYFWNFRKGKIINSVQTQSQVTGVVYHNNNVITSHAEPENRLRMWNYPNLSNGLDFDSHDRKVLSMKLKDDILVSISADETLRFWNIDDSRNNNNNSDQIFSGDFEFIEHKVR